MALADVTVTGVITDPVGVPLPSFTILPSVSLTNNTVSIPLDPLDNVMCGIYQFRIVTDYDNGVDPPTSFLFTRTINFCPETITVALVWQPNCLVTPLVRVVDQTAYLGTIDSISMILSPPPNAPSPYNTAYTSIAGAVDSGADKAQAGLWTVALNTIAHIDYATYSWSYQVTHFTDNNGNVLASSLRNISCGLLCSVNCCMNDAWVRWDNARTLGNKQNEAQYGSQLGIAQLIYNQAWRAIECDGVSDIQSYIDKIKAVLNCTNCGDCEDAAGGLITPLYEGSGTSYTFGTSTLSLTYPGGVVTYNLTAAHAATLAAVRNYAIGLDGDLLAAGFTILGPVPTGSNPVLNSYTLSFTGTFPTVNQKYTENFTIDWGAGPTMTRGSGKLSGALFKRPVGTDLEPINFVGLLSWPWQPAQFRIQRFYTTPPAGGDPIAYSMIIVLNNPDYRTGFSPINDASFTIQVDGPDGNNLALATVRNKDGDVTTWGAIALMLRSATFSITIQQTI